MRISGARVFFTEKQQISSLGVRNMQDMFKKQQGQCEYSRLSEWKNIRRRDQRGQEEDQVGSYRPLQGHYEDFTE